MVASAYDSAFAAQVSDAEAPDSDVPAHAPEMIAAVKRQELALEQLAILKAATIRTVTRAQSRP